MNSRTKLLIHQQEAVNKMLPTRIGALFMEMGTGKSRTVIELAIIRQQRINNIIWFCPVSLMPTIKYEILKHTDCTDDDINVFGPETGERNLPNCWWHIVGIESMSSSARIVCAVNKLINTGSMIIVDESSYIKGHNSNRTQRITDISQKARYRIILTGTPLSQGVVDLYAQMRFLSPKILGYNSFYSFSANHLEYDKKFKNRIINSHNTDFLAAKIKPYVYQVTKDECLDLPDKIYKKCYFDMSHEQQKNYDAIKNELLLELTADDYDVDQMVIFKLFTALQQIVCGFYNHKPHRKAKTKQYEYCHYRTDLFAEVVNGIPNDEKIIIWAKYHYDINQIKKTLRKEFPGQKFSEFHGNLTQKQKDAGIDAFRHDARFLIATPSCGGHGLTLNEASHVIFYSNSFKYSDRIQAEDRNHRIGQCRKVVYIDLICSHSIDERIAHALWRKEDVVKDFRISVDKLKGDKKQIKKAVNQL